MRKIIVYQVIAKTEIIIDDDNTSLDTMFELALTACKTSSVPLGIVKLNVLLQ